MKETLELLLTPGILALGIAMLAIMFRMTHKRIDDLRSQMVSNHNHLSEKLDAVDKRLSEKIDDVDERLSEKIDTVDSGLSEKIDAVDKRLSEKIDAVDKRLSEKIDGADMRLSGMINTLDQQIHGMNQRIDTLNNQFVAHLESHRFSNTYNSTNGLRQ